MARGSIDLIVAQEAQRQIDRAIASVRELQREIIQTARTARDNQPTVNAPSGLADNAAANAQLTEELIRQSAIVTQLQAQITRLSEARQRHSTRTAQERVEARQLLQIENEEARLLSDLTGAYGRLDIQHRRAVRNAQNLGAEFGRNSRQFRDATREANRLDRELRGIDGTLGRSQRNVGNYTSAFNRFGSVLGSLGITAGIAGVVSLGKEIFDGAKETQSLNNALLQVTGTSENYGKQQAFLTRISEAYGAEIGSLTKTFTQFYVSAKDKLAGNEIQGIFESVTKAGAAMGLTVESQERAFLALNQMMSKSTIQSEELKGQLGEALPGAFSIMAKSLNVSEEQLGVMLKQGEVLAADVLPKFAKQLEITYGIENKNRIDSIAASTNRLSNTWKNFVSSISSSKIGNFFAVQLSILTSGLDLAADKLGRFIGDSEKYRKKDLSLIRETGRNDAKNLLKRFEEESEKSEAQRIGLNKFASDADKKAYDAEERAKTKDKISQLKQEYAQEAILNAKKLDAKQREEFEKLTLKSIDLQGKIQSKSNQDLAKVNGTDEIIELRNTKQRIKELNEQISKRAGFIEGLMETQAKQKTTNSEEIESAKDLNFELKDYLANQYALLKLKGEIEQKGFEDIYKDESKSFEERIKAQQNFVSKSIELTEKARVEAQRILSLELNNNKDSLREKYNEYVKNDKITAEQKANAAGELNRAIASYEKQNAFDVEKINVEHGAAIVKIKKDTSNQVSELIAKNIELITTGNINEQELNDLREYKNKLLNITKETSEARIKEIEKENKANTESSQRKRLQFELDVLTNNLNDKLSKEGDYSEAVLKIRKEIVDKTKEILDIGVENEKENNDKVKEYLKSFQDEFAGKSGFSSLFDILNKQITDFGDNFYVTFNAIAEAAQEAYNFISQASEGNFAAEYSRLDSQYELYKSYAAEGSAARIQLEEQYEAKKKEIANRENKAKQKQAIFNIAIDTAQAIIAAVAKSPLTGGLPFSAIAGAIGAAQIAVVASQKIPQYFEGGTHYGGLAMINDAGGANYVETVVTPDGKATQYSGRNVVTDLPSGTEIYTPEQWNDWQKQQLLPMLNSKGISGTSNIQIENNGITYQEMDQIIGKHFSNIKTHSTVIDKKGFQSFVTNGNSKTIINNSRVTGSGLSV